MIQNGFLHMAIAFSKIIVPTNLEGYLVSYINFKMRISRKSLYLWEFIFINVLINNKILNNDIWHAALETC